VVEISGHGDPQVVSHSKMPHEPCGTTTNTSHSASTVNDAASVPALQTALLTTCDDQARQNYSLRNFEETGLQISEAMDTFVSHAHSQKPIRAGSPSRHNDETASVAVPLKKLQVSDLEYDTLNSHPYCADVEVAFSSRMNQREELSPTEGYPNYQASFTDHHLQACSSILILNEHSIHSSNQSTSGVDQQQFSVADGGCDINITQGTQNLLLRGEQHNNLEGLQNNPLHKSISEEMLEKKYELANPSDMSKGLPHPVYNPDSTDIIAERLNPLSHQRSSYGRAVMGDTVEEVRSCSCAVAESSSEDSDGDQLHINIDHEIQIAAEQVNEEVNPSPNDVCPICGKKFRIGEIQKFKKHVDNCF